MTGTGRVARRRAPARRCRRDSRSRCRASTNQSAPNTTATTDAAAATHCQRRGRASAAHVRNQARRRRGPRRGEPTPGSPPRAAPRRPAAVGHRCGRDTTPLCCRPLTSARASGSPARYSSISRRSSSSTASMRVRRQELLDLVGSQFAIHDPSIPRSSSCLRSRISPVRIRLLIVSLPAVRGSARPRGTCAHRSTRARWRRVRRRTGSPSPRAPARRR